MTNKYSVYSSVVGINPAISSLKVPVMDLYDSARRRTKKLIGAGMRPRFVRWISSARALLKDVILLSHQL